MTSALIPDWIQDAVVQQERWNHLVGNIAGRDRYIDEVSLLAANPLALDRLVAYMVRNGWDHFNKDVRDVSRPTSGDADAVMTRFEFLSYPGRDWRVEAMCVYGGRAPLHRHQSGTVIHASFKCEDMADYEEVVTELEASCTMLAAYQNSYGHYSYFNFLHNYPPFLKPRVNTRDDAGN